MYLDGIRQQVRASLARYLTDQQARDALLNALGRPGYCLHPEAACRSGSIALSTYLAIRSDVTEVALKGAAAVEMEAEAAFMFDAVADRQTDPDGLDPAEELALAIALLNCGAAVACEAVGLAGNDGCGHEALLLVHGSYAQAAAGQFLDARLPGEVAVTTDDALRMTALKGGSLGRLAAGLGAALATTDRKIVALCSEFGANLFTYLQLVDDLRDAFPEEGEALDLLQRKMTVPLVFWYNSLPHAQSLHGSGIIAERRSPGPELREQFRASGAELFGAIVAEAYLNKARENLAALKGLLCRVERLEHLVHSVQIFPGNLAAGPQEAGSPGNTPP